MSATFSGGVTISGGGWTLTPTPDPYFMYNTLLLPGNGTNNATNNTFIDGSTNNFTVTNNGNTKQGTFTPFGGNWSNYFDGTGDYLSVPYTTSNFDWWTSGVDFTVEAWVFPTDLSTWQYATSPVMVGNASATSSTNYWSFGPASNGTVAFKYFNGVSVTVYSTATIVANTWNHIAMTKTSAGITIFVNGIAEPATAISGTPQSSTGSNLQIGQINSTSATGYISNLRIVRGTAVYTGNFIPSITPLTPITNTTLLTCQSNSLIDNSLNELAITKSGDTTVQRFSPFSPIPILTPTSYSGYFDGSGDYLQIANDASNRMGTGDWTAEGWVYIKSYSLANAIFAKGGSTTDWFFGTYPSTGRLYTGVGTTDYFATTGPVVPLNTWCHIALVQSGSTQTIYLNGVVGDSRTSTVNYTSTGALNIGRGRDNSTNYFNGYISNARLVKGVAVYTGPFTPPSGPLTATQSSGTNISAITGTSTSVLTCQSTTFIDNSTNSFTITLNGNSQPTSQNPFNNTYSSIGYEYNPVVIGGSAYFDGTGDFLTVPTNTTAFNLTADFTIEFWVRPTTIALGGVLSNGQTLFQGNAVAIILNHATQTNKLSLWVYNINAGVSILQSTTILANQWTHIAIVRSGSTMALYQDGVSITTTTSASTIYLSETILNIGKYWNGAFTGYISNLRIVTGTAVYTDNFVLPTAPLTAITNTTLLLNSTNSAIIDNTMMNNLETAGDAKISTVQSKFGGSSMYFDGTGDYLTTPTSPSLDFGTGDFTIECWIYPSALTSNRIILDRWTSGNAGGWQLYWRSTGTSIAFYVGAAILLQDPSTTNIALNTWAYVTVTRSGTTNRLFINGTVVATATDSTSLSSTLPLTVGSQLSTGTNYFNGYIEDLRITKGYARYTANFSVPTGSPPLQ